MPPEEADSTDGTAKPRQLAEPEECPGGAKIKPPFEMGVSDFDVCTLDELSLILEDCTMQELEAIVFSVSVPKTPNGSSVSYVTPSCSHSSSTYHSTLDANTVSTYGVTLISNGSCKYNCHSYAWHSQSTSNIYWINNPSIYMTDGSYYKVVSGLGTSSLSAVPGDRVIYGSSSSPDHSAIITSSATGAPLATRTVKSKWGKAGVFSHSVANVPSVYDTSDVSAWHR